MQNETEMPSYCAVRTGSYDEAWTVYRFAPTKAGAKRADEYARQYNKSLLKAMNVPEGDLSLQPPDWNKRPDEYDRAQRVDTYRMESATVEPRYIGNIIGDDDPMPTDYPHSF